MADIPDEITQLAELSDQEWRIAVQKQFELGHSRMGRMEKEVAKNTQMTEEIRNDTKEFLEVFKAVKGGFKVLGWIGAAAKWIGMIGGAGVFLWKVFHGQWPWK